MGFKKNQGAKKRLPPTSGLLLDKSELIQVSALKVKCLNNMSLCQLKMENYQSVVEMLSPNPQDVKSLYRIGVAHCQLSNYPKSIQALEKALTIEPSNRAVTLKLQEVKAKRSRDEGKLQKGLKKMFA